MSVPSSAKGPSAQEIDALVAQFSAGNYPQAGQLALSLVQRFPGHPFGWKALGTLFQQTGQSDAALAPLQKAAELSPKDAQLHSNLGVVLEDLGRLDEAEASLRRALALDANLADAQVNLGSLLQNRGRFGEAEACFRRAVERRPDLADAHYNLGNLLNALGRSGEAEACFRKALQRRPDHARACNNLAVALRDQGRLDEAEAACRQALERKPDLAEAFGNLGLILQDQGRYDEALAAYGRALEIDPVLAEVHNNLGNVLQDIGRLKEAEACYRRALALRPDYFQAHSNLLFMLNYALDEPPETRLAEAREYGRKATAKAAAPFSSWADAEPGGRLRVGFVSGDFRNHPVGYFLEGLLSRLDASAFELVAYPSSAGSDELTARIRPHFSGWHPLVGLDDAAAARRIHDDGIHILIDLSGHSRYNRLPVFAWKPAPVQVAWLGYFATTGVAEIGWLIADPWTLPPEEEAWFTEKIRRMPETRLCFTPPGLDIAVSALPALVNGYVTFGCFNNLTKMNDAVVALWSRVLAAVPGSRLLLKAKQLSEAATRQRTVARFAAHGVDAAQLILEGPEPRENYFAACHRVDIALDPFPYPGGTTTVENLWMGVPVLTLAGSSFLSRQGAGFLMNAGLPEWVAGDADDYVRRVVLHAGDLPRLATLRAGLRAQAIASPVMDAGRFARHFEEALHGIWQHSGR